MFSRARAIVIGAGAACALLALAGCSSGSTTGGATPDEPDPTPGSEVAAAWLDDGRGVGVVTYGSSSCVPSVAGVEGVDGVLSVELADPEDQACTMDYVPRAVYVALPEGMSPADDLAVAVTGDYAGDVILAGDPSLAGMPGDMTEYAPSAGWAGEGTIVILTWGSSSCAPVVEGAEVTGDSEVTVTFETPAADQVCTMDMAPRVTIATVDGPDEPVGATAVLTGGEFDAVPVPIAGTP
ncbi:hypothetical protein P0L94_15660 [Microbacter sp. GSS18]|nr:hypothetical protein P0L94_15660 [Microbacter sp. GSS18]